MNDATPAIRTASLTRRYDDVVALDGVDLTVEPGSVVGLLGHNGAGKTTLVRILTTLLQPTDGTAEVCGFDVTASPTEVRARIGLTGQYVAVDEALTGRENIELVARLLGLPPAQVRARAGELLAELGLDDHGDRLARRYSGGLRRRLDLAASLVSRPEVLFLDEPTTGLDPTSRQQLWESISQLARSGTTVLLTTHYLEEADRLADRIVLIDQGAIVAEGTPWELKRRVGGYMIDLTLADTGERDRAAQALQTLATAPPAASGERRLSVPIADTETVLPALRSLDAAGVTVAGLEVHTPTLDDVFAAITGQAAERESTQGSDDPTAHERTAARRGPQRRRRAGGRQRA
ncbi:MAG: ATP-binding cassette domain-containing protein [Nitriliruptoraceae bacterium]